MRGHVLISSRSTYSVLLGIFFALFISALPWEALRGSTFPDLLNYIKKIEDIRLYGFFFDQQISSPINYLTHEYLWFCISYLVAISDVDPRLALALLSSFCAYAYITYLYDRTKSVYICLMLANPIAVTLLASQIRGAVAMAIVLLVARKSNKHWHIVVALLVVSFIHLAMAAVLGIAVAAYYISTRNIRTRDIRG